MKDDKKSEEIKNDPYGCDEPESIEIKSCSATDCTGLIPALPESDAELESYESLYHFSGSLFTKE